MLDLTFRELAGGGALALAAIATLVQISPIKLNPWSALAKAIGRAINSEVINQVKSLEAEVNLLKKTVDERAATDARIRILRFGDEVLHGTQHSKEHFDQILMDITEYEQYCDAHKDFKNNMAALTISAIKANYQKRLQEHDFL